MGGDTPLSGLAFDIIFDIFPDSSRWWQFIANTTNWIMTNIKGMTFGVLFGAAALTLLSVIKTRSFENGFANAALGGLIGAPLGVCVNCAAPIALGLHMGRMRLETTLAALVASPTLNIIVVTMSFSLLPLHIAATKLLLAVFMVLVVVPLLCRYILVAETNLTRNGVTAWVKVSEARGFSAWIGRALAPNGQDEVPAGLPGAVGWFVRRFSHNLFFIAVITVPMMLLAAMLGALVAMNFDSSTFVNILPRGGLIPVLSMMLVIAIVASFVPAPIALDVILTIVLMGIGMGSQYATVALIGLGSFSVYAFIILWRAISFRTAMSLWIATIILAMAGGIIALKTSKMEYAVSANYIDRFLNNRPSFALPTIPELPRAANLEELASAIQSQSIRPEALQADYASSRNSVVTAEFTPLGGSGPEKQKTLKPGFKRIPGAKLGFEEFGIITPMHKFAPSMMLGGIAAGDIHNDGWTDIVVRRPTGARGLSLYANIGGKFRRQNIDLGPLAKLEIANTAFADLDNDGWLDLVVTTYWDGVYILKNREGNFSQDEMIHIAGPELTVAMAVSFSDMNGDGRLDILLGEWTSYHGLEGWGRLQPTTSANRILWNEGNDVYRPEVIAGSFGQTLSALVTDVNRDGQPDYLKGDDVAATDQFVFFSRDGATHADLGRQPFPYFMRTSMSYDEGDWNNDLVPDYYGGQISERGGGGERDATKGNGNIMRLCRQFAADLGWTQDKVRECAAEIISTDGIRDFQGGFMSKLCRSKLMSERDATACGILNTLGPLKNIDYVAQEVTPEEAYLRCHRALDRWSFTAPYCDTFKIPTVSTPKGEAMEALHKPALRVGNILMTGSSTGGFENSAPDQNIDFPGWTWNSRFVDLDQDRWQDLLIMTGSWLSPSRSTTNMFYHNQSGKFVDATEKYGFYDLTPSYGFAALDFDRDGDIDIIRPPDGRTVIVHRNEQAAGPALWVHLRDRIGNRMGIDARVTLCTDGETRVRPGKCQTRPINASGGFMSFDPIAAHFGLGNARNISLIEVVWRDGEITRVLPAKLLGGEIIISRQAR